MSAGGTRNRAAYDGRAWSIRTLGPRAASVFVLFCIIAAGNSATRGRVQYGLIPPDVGHGVTPLGEGTQFIINSRFTAPIEERDYYAGAIVNPDGTTTPAVLPADGVQTEDEFDFGGEAAAASGASAEAVEAVAAAPPETGQGGPATSPEEDSCRKIDRGAEADFDPAWLSQSGSSGSTGGGGSSGSQSSPATGGAGGAIHIPGSASSAGRHPASADSPAPLHSESIYRRRSHLLRAEDAIDSNIRHTGSTPTSGGLTQPVQPAHIQTLQNSQSAGDLARGNEMVELAMQKQRALEGAARRDTQALTRAYDDRSIEDFGLRMGTAQRSLDDAIRSLETSQGGLDSGDAAVASRVYMNARDKARAAQEIITEEINQRAIDPMMLFKNAINAPPGQGAANAMSALGSVIPSLSAARGGAGAMANPLSQDAASDRAALFFGLSPEEQAKKLKELRLAENRDLRLPGGAVRTVAILHGGYLFGSGKTGMDCSTFVSRSLPADVRKGSFTTLDFAAMWYYRKHGKLPNPPKYKNGRDALVKTMADNFIAVDLYGGEQLSVGDVLVFRAPHRPMGHIFIITDYDPVSMAAEVIESSQSMGGIHRRKLPLTAQPPGAPVRHIRGGLFALRLKPDNTPSCKYSEVASRRAGTRPSRGKGFVPAGTRQGAAL